jgi:hypothetical protein
VNVPLVIMAAIAAGLAKDGDLATAVILASLLRDVPRFGEFRLEECDERHAVAAIDWLGRERYRVTVELDGRPWAEGGGRPS